MLENLKKYSIILASNSPRRKELLEGLGIEYKVKTLPDVDESYPETLIGEQIPLFIARKKAEAYIDTIEDNELIITADTIVWLDGKVLGKPEDSAHAKEMLASLSGKTHQVMTGVCITTKDIRKEFVSVTDVTFNTLSMEEIDYYVINYKPFDKAGAYGIQEWIGYIGVQSISGSYFNVVGLPIQRLYRELIKM
ncbi:Maf-like protein [Phocaeicola paurosaccharolyticus]|jgi:septum formation protein|uniref:Maf-like protein n=1 Tax=Phocaeicola paurosaccharolyticus TaxID=732242 RepID=UPI002FE3AFBA